MASKVGLTLAQAAKLIELADANSRQAKVRTFHRESSQHRGRAFLLRLLNDHQAIIKPFEHRREEVVELDTLSFWRGGCDFDIEAAVNAVETVERNSMSNDSDDPWVVLSKKWNGVWAGETRKWTKQTPTCRRFDDRDAAQQCANKLARNTMSSDAAVVRLSEAHAFLHPTPSVMVESKKVETVAAIVNKPSLPLFDDDIAAILAFDRTAWNKAFDDCQAAAKELQDIETMRQEALDKLNRAKTALSELTDNFRENKSNVRNRSIKTEAPAATNGVTKPGLLKETVLSILDSGERVETHTMFEKVLAKAPTSTHGSVQQVLYKLRALGLIVGSNADGWLKA
jgi:hypothetical protein